MAKNKHPEQQANQSSFEKELQNLINKHSKENESNTPDFILAEYMHNALKIFNKAVNRRSHFNNEF